ncbi:MAG: adenine phosphoribosyltransferase [Patescibacteria group bacterium]|jgi:adenine phosphoribosyltransferase
MTVDKLKLGIRTIPNWPKKGIIFRDITPILEDKDLFRLLIDELAKLVPDSPIDKVVGIDARGFILASALAYKLGTGLVIVRKKGKLPYKTISQEYALEYASGNLEIHSDSIRPGENVLLCDDLLATGGTMRAASDLVQKLGGNIKGVLFFIVLESLRGINQLSNFNVKYLVKF